MSTHALPLATCNLKTVNSDVQSKKKSKTEKTKNKKQKTKIDYEGVTGTNRTNV